MDQQSMSPMRDCLWLWSVLLSFLQCCWLGDRKGNRPVKNTQANYPQMFCSRKSAKETRWWTD